jgi:hypothetical protein
MTTAGSHQGLADRGAIRYYRAARMIDRIAMLSPEPRYRSRFSHSLGSRANMTPAGTRAARMIDRIAMFTPEPRYRGVTEGSGRSRFSHRLGSKRFYQAERT